MSHIETLPKVSTSHSSAFLIAMEWLVVLVPAAWGIYLTALRAANLFR